MARLVWRNSAAGDVYEPKLQRILAGVRMQGLRGFTREADYTWSHEIDITSFDNNTVSNSWSLKYNKGTGQLDRRHILSIDYVYAMPLFEKSPALVRLLAGD